MWSLVLFSAECCSLLERVNTVHRGASNFTTFRSSDALLLMIIQLKYSELTNHNRVSRNRHLVFALSMFTPANKYSKSAISTLL